MTGRRSSSSTRSPSTSASCPAPGSADTRRLARAIPVFLKNLFELAAGNPRVVVIVTLATAADAYGRETTELADLLDELGGGFQEVLSDAQSVLARSGQVIRPAGDEEIAEILKRRLFERIDPAAAEQAGSVYQAYYEELLVRGEQLGAERRRQPPTASASPRPIRSTPS